MGARFARRVLRGAGASQGGRRARRRRRQFPDNSRGISNDGATDRPKSAGFILTKWIKTGNQAWAGGKLRSMLTLSPVMTPWILLAIFSMLSTENMKKICPENLHRGSKPVRIRTSTVVSRVSAGMVAEIFDYFQLNRFLVIRK
jgi:hypothetical protein